MNKILICLITFCLNMLFKEIRLKFAGNNKCVAKYILNVITF